MVTHAHPFDTVDLPGELHPPPDDEPSACGRCGQPAADDFAGLCVVCHDRLMYGGVRAGCGLGLALVAAVAGDFGTQAAPLAHLIGCAACRALLSDLANLVRVAEMEADTEAPYAIAGKLTA